MSHLREQKFNLDLFNVACTLFADIILEINRVNTWNSILYNRRINIYTTEKSRKIVRFIIYIIINRAEKWSRNVFCKSHCAILVFWQVIYLINLIIICSHINNKVSKAYFGSGSGSGCSLPKPTGFFSASSCVSKCSSSSTLPWTNRIKPIINVYSINRPPHIYGECGDIFTRIINCIFWFTLWVLFFWKFTSLSDQKISVH